MSAVLLPGRKPACSSGSSYSIFYLINFSNNDEKHFACMTERSNCSVICTFFGVS